MASLKVVKSSSPYNWYADSVGDIMNLFGEFNDMWRSSEPNGAFNSISKQDAKMVLDFDEWLDDMNYFSYEAINENHDFNYDDIRPFEDEYRAYLEAI